MEGPVTEHGFHSFQLTGQQESKILLSPLLSLALRLQVAPNKLYDPEEPRGTQENPVSSVARSASPPPPFPPPGPGAVLAPLGLLTPAAVFPHCRHEFPPPTHPPVSGEIEALLRGSSEAPPPGCFPEPHSDASTITCTAFFNPFSHT
ncbi:splicing factor 3B subunit 4-like isoform X1 [Cricetulus griseus]|uniref:splicing factor 3B subunit 4-like isoform X1 n=1 Tax=Cricetulus griseus TaxID=10029 RepID=UPI0015C31E92|nr:splicing factor 3B subunit 4-like isoform X1 [Cricetulus griseus]